MTTTKPRAPRKSAATKAARPSKATIAKATKPARKTTAKTSAVARKATKVVNKAARRVTQPAPRKSGPANTRSTAKPKRMAARPAARKTAADSNARLRKIVLAALDDMKARDIREIDVRGRSDFADLMVIASGTSSRHVKAIADTVVIKAKAAGLPPLGVEGSDDAEWVLVDLGDIIVHVMQPRTREFYGLERLWTVGDDAPPEAEATA